jgi:hypothetical protein
MPPALKFQHHPGAAQRPPWRAVDPGRKKWQRTITPEQRFWAKIRKGGPDECWEWIGLWQSHKGYGLFRPHREVVMAHRFSWELVHGPIPDGILLDHKCFNPACVNPAHLRLATKSQNNCNQFRRKDNTSGFKGVSFYRQTQKWKAQIQVNGKKIALGYFSTPEAAYAAFCEASHRLHGAFSNLGVAI